MDGACGAVGRSGDRRHQWMACRLCAAPLISYDARHAVRRERHNALSVSRDGHQRAAGPADTIGVQRASVRHSDYSALGAGGMGDLGLCGAPHPFRPLCLCDRRGRNGRQAVRRSGRALQTLRVCCVRASRWVCLDPADAPGQRQRSDNGNSASSACHRRGCHGRHAPHGRRRRPAPDAARGACDHHSSERDELRTSILSFRTLCWERASSSPSPSTWIARA